MDTHNDVDGSENNYAGQKKPDTKQIRVHTVWFQIKFEKMKTNP